MTTTARTIDLSPDTYLWFDLDDTLWDMTGNSDISLAEIYVRDPDVNAAYSRYGKQAWLDNYHAVNAELWVEYAQDIIDRATLRRERFARPLQMVGMTRDKAVEAATRLDTLYLDILGRCTATVDGAVEAVRHMQSLGFRTGIVSNGFAEVQFNKMRSAGMEGLFTPVVLSDDGVPAKPHREFFDTAVQRAGTDAANSVIIGDNPITDIQGALAAGWKAAVWYNPTAQELPEALEPYADRIVVLKDMAQLPSVFNII